MLSRLLLPLNLQFFSADTGSGGGASDEGSQSTETNQSQENETKTDENMIPKSRFDEVNEKYKEMQKQLATLTEAQKQAEAERQQKAQEDAEKRGEYEQLYRQKESEVEKLSSFKERAKSLEGVITEMVNAKLEKIPEDMHDLIPSNMSVEEKLSWINKAESKGMFKVEDNTEQSIGESMNHKQPKRDISKMSAMEKLFMGYGKK